MIDSCYKIENDNFRIQIGTFNKKNPKNIYVNCSSYITPDDGTDYSNARDRLSSLLNKSIRKAIQKNGNYGHKYICVINLPEERMKVGKKSFMSVEYHISQNIEDDFKNILPSTRDITDEVLSDFVRQAEDEGFCFSKTK